MDKNEINSENPTPLEEEVEVLSFAVHCFYGLDDKYAETTDAAKVADWIKEKSQTIRTQNISGDIFSNNGGGPNGAEWNASTALYLAIVTSAKPVVTINDQPYHNIIATDNGITWLEIPHDYWENALKDIEQADIEKMFSKELIAERENNKNMPLNVGQIMEFNIQANGNEATKYFHVAFGE